MGWGVWQSWVRKSSDWGRMLTLAGGTGLPAAGIVQEGDAVPMPLVPVEGPQLCGPSFGQLLSLFT